MKKFVLSAALFFSALAGNAEGISSPSGMVKLDFELTKDGRQRRRKAHDSFILCYPHRNTYNGRQYNSYQHGPLYILNQ